MDSSPCSIALVAPIWRQPKGKRRQDIIDTIGVSCGKLKIEEGEKKDAGKYIEYYRKPRDRTMEYKKDRAKEG